MDDDDWQIVRGRGMGLDLESCLLIRPCPHSEA